MSIFWAANVLANSNWMLAASDDLGNKFFIEINSVQKSGDSLTFWHRKNNKVRDEKGVLSWKVQQTINCRSRENIYRFYMNFDDLDNNGRVLMNQAAVNPRWEPIPPDTVLWGIYRYICK